MNGIARDQRGQAMAEFAMYLPALVLLILFAFYIAEVGIRHVEAQVDVRHATWHALRVPGGGAAGSPGGLEVDLDAPPAEPSMDDPDGMLATELSEVHHFASKDIDAYAMAKGYDYVTKYFDSDFSWSSYSFTKRLVLDPASYDATQARYGSAWAEFKTDYACALGYETWQHLHEEEEWSELTDGLLGEIEGAL